MRRNSLVSRSEPLQDLDDWQDDVRRRYPTPESGSFNPTDPDKSPNQFRDYRAEARPCVREFYRLNHTNQTVDFVRSKQREYVPLGKVRMSIWEATKVLDTLVDDSDPDTNVPQIEHAFQTAESIREQGHPRWFILAGFVHDMGKMLCVFGEPQWAVVGDTFPVGCRFSDKIVFSEFFADNPDSKVAKYQTVNGIYSEGCGLDNVLMSWGHDEYLYHVTKNYLPLEAQYMIRYHSFYPLHRGGEYTQLLNEQDKKMLPWVKKFNPFDLYTKSHERPNVAELMPFYEDLVGEFFPNELDW
ncbi:MAG: inositol oxygenase [Planctomycetaceae bacterium]|nr:inositol oxygenase [Planctomycetaceae bacterium]